MPAILNIPPTVPKDSVSTSGSKFTIQRAEIKEGVQTSMGKISKALTIEGNLDGGKDIFSYLFSVDKESITGSVGRILSKFGFADTNELNAKSLKEKMVGKDVTVKRRNDKLYWY